MSVARIRRVVRQYIEGEAETKVVDYTIGPVSPVVATPYLSWLTPIRLGTNYFNRIGAELRLMRVYLRLSIQRNAAAVAPSQLVRVILALDTSTEGSLPVFGLPTSLFSGATPRVQDQRNQLATTRWWVMDDRVVDVSTGDQTIRVTEMSHSLRAHAHYLSDTGGIADAFQNHLYLFMIGSDAVDGANISGSVRIWFQDM